MEADSDEACLRTLGSHAPRNTSSLIEKCNAAVPRPGCRVLAGLIVVKQVRGRDLDRDISIHCSCFQCPPEVALQQILRSIVRSPELVKRQLTYLFLPLCFLKLFTLR